MTRLSTKLWCLSVSALGVAAATLTAGSAPAQCSTCVTPTVAYSPVVVQPTTVSTGWYPGRMFDQWRMNRAANRASVYTASYAPYTAAYAPYTAAYAPYTAAYAPTSYSVGYAPTSYSVGYAPTAYSASYAPAATSYVASYAPAASSCSGCAQPSYTPVVASYAPTTLYRPVALTPVVADVGCSACAAAAPCSACASCAPVVEQAVYSEASPGCSSCVGAVGQSTFTEVPAAASQGSIVTTPGAPSPNNPPPPEFDPDEAIPDAADSPYDANRPEAGAVAPPAEEGATPGPVADEAEADPAAFEAPRLLDPHNDLRANRPTVDVHHAVYRQASSAKSVSTAAAVRPVVAKTQAEMDAAGWYSVPRSR